MSSQEGKQFATAVAQTFVVLDPNPVAILQRLNTDIFSPRVHEDIEAVTKALIQAGLPSPTLMPCRDNRLWITDSDEGVWRVMTSYTVMPRANMSVLVLNWSLKVSGAFQGSVPPPAQPAEASGKCLAAAERL